MTQVLNTLKEVVVEKPADVIIRQLKELLISGQLQPGDRLPPERKLSEKFGVSRTYVRDAIRKLEFYGILKTRPQSGTFVAGLGVSALEILISDVLKLDGYSFISLVETRHLLEMASVEQACERHIGNDIFLLEESLNNYLEKANKKIKAVEEDLMFHSTIAELSKNKVLKSFLLSIIPDILSNYAVFNVCQTQTNKALVEHITLFEQIKNRDSEGAKKTMNNHLEGVMTFAKSMVQ